MPEKNALDYTALSTFLTCRRKFDFRINRGLVGREEGKSTHFGKAIHKALDSWYTDKNVDKAIATFVENFEENLDVDDKRTNRMGEWIIRNYDKQYADQPWELVESETTFSIPVNPTFTFTGRIDKIIRWHNALWVVDHKTASGLGPQYFNFAEPNMQFMGYVWAARKMGFDVCGVIVDAILVAKGLLPTDSATGHKKNPNLTPFARYDVYYKEEHLDTWLETVNQIKSDIDLSEQVGVWYPNFTACTYFGECPYRRVCKEESSIQQRIIDMDYKIEHWNPLQKENE